MTDRLEEFKKIFFMPPGYVVMNSFSTHILRKMDASERKEAEHLLLEAGEQGTSDPRAVQGLAELRSGAAIPLLRRRLPRPEADDTGWVRFPGHIIDTAVALWQIDRDPAAFYYPSTVARRATDPFVLIDACVALRRFPFSETIDTVRPLMRHTEMLVRCHAVQTALFVTGLNTDECAIPDPAIRIMQDNPAVWEDVIAEVDEAIREIRLPSVSEEMLQHHGITGAGPGERFP
ncbi:MULTISPECIES: hypothetical protein [unclassified Methanoregula]|uniref:hypothetical protein n=1 Tax=unclassified Methanoregula TaxID=2649730 RepID=UPI0009D4B411|nr:MULTISPECIES: hypothetical protein [unclassified Methanoregula]OPX62882.1 MAG: hypothetical protein A4E33_02011 [Methanoregula sp. PtaB.Bin085]OPY35319.1 MAG: hypothetical protein A4E34_00847 [Methanoregula sp. PtaU1.Bin006]